MRKNKNGKFFDRHLNSRKAKMALSIYAGLMTLSYCGASGQLSELQENTEYYTEYQEQVEKVNTLETTNNKLSSENEKLNDTIENLQKQLNEFESNEEAEETETVEENKDKTQLEQELSDLIKDDVTIEVDTVESGGDIRAYIVVYEETFDPYESHYQQLAMKIFEYMQDNPIENVTLLGIRFTVNGEEFVDAYGNKCTEPQMMSSAWIKVDTLEKINFDGITYESLYELLEDYHFNKLVDNSIWN